MDTPLKEGVFEIFKGDTLLLVVLQDIVHVNLLGSTHAGENICRHKSSDFESHMGILLSFRLGMDGGDQKVVELLNLGVIESM